MESTSLDEKILSYNDVVLRRSDLDVLSGPYFLNDRIIEFYFSYLTSCYPFEEGGSHWSLLAFDRNENIFVHHDSSGGINNMHANKVFRAVIYSIARQICRWYGSDERPKHAKDLWFSTVTEQIMPSLVGKMRNEILELVQSLMVK
ncbi:NEDD8-specific protease 1 isoform X2 [Henckelia pumila]|uniref:NEDD8-specific protease 1 isoform X2 n=1 Tax=Henckelia pumila TaxID=405737 RepID=UPI003C6E9140